MKSERQTEAREMLSSPLPPWGPSPKEADAKLVGVFRTPNSMLQLTAGLERLIEGQCSSDVHRC